MIINTVYELTNQVISKYSSGGYLTDLEFNNYARIAQNDKLDDSLKYTRDTSFKSSVLSAFKTDKTTQVTNGKATKPSDYRYYETATYFNFMTGEVMEVPFEFLTNDEFSFRVSSALDQPDLYYPALTEKDGFLQIYPKAITSMNLTYIKNPPAPIWGFTIVNNRKVFEESTSTDFLFGEDDISDLVMRIVKLVGIEISDTEKFQMVSSNPQKQE